MEAQTRFAENANHRDAAAEPVATSIESLLAVNDPSVGDADLRVLRNTSASIVEPLPSQFTTPLSDYGISSSGSSPRSQGSAALSSSQLLSAEPAQSARGSSPSGSSDSNGSWSSIASEYGLDEQDVGMWRGVDLDWDLLGPGL